MKNYYTQTLSFVLFLLCAAGVARAQHVWQNSLPQPAAAAAPVVRASDATEGKIYLGHCKYSDYIYPWDGLSQSVDCRVCVAVKLTRDMFKDYIGGEVKSLRIGWDEQNEKGEVEMFVRTSFDGENLASGEGMVAFGWNELNLLESFTIPDVDELVVGYYTDLKANLCCIPKFYPQDVDNSCFLYSGETDTQGKEIWHDLKSLGTMAIMLVVHDTKGQFQDLAAVDGLRYEHIGKQADASAAIFTITHRGSNGQHRSEALFAHPVCRKQARDAAPHLPRFGSRPGQTDEGERQRRGRPRDEGRVLHCRARRGGCELCLPPDRGILRF